MKSIKMQEKTNWIVIVEKIFFVLFSLYAALSMCSLTFGKIIISIVMWPSFVLGLLIFGYRVLHFQSYIKMPFCKLLFFLLGSIGISTLINYQYNFKRNVISCLYWLLYFFVLYVIEQGTTPEKIRKDFRFIATVFTALISLSVLLSFIVFFCGYAKTVEIKNDFTYYIGFKIGRLWGVFVNLNRGSVSVAVSSMLLIYFIKTVNKVWFRIGAGVMIFFNLMYIALADSRSGAICVGLLVGFFTFFMLIHRAQGKGLSRKILAVCLALLALVGGYFLPRRMKTAYNGITMLIYQISTEDGKIEESDEKKLNLVERGYDLSDDISNRRFDVWKSGMEIMLHSGKNIMVGTSFNGILTYAERHLPRTYIVDNDFDKIGTMDNDIFNLLVAQGLVGILIGAIFIIGVMILIWKGFRSVKKENIFELSMMLAIIVAIAGSSMFTSLVLYYFSQNAIIFWVFLGMSVYLLKSEEESLNNDD